MGMLDRVFSLVRVNRKLIFGKNATMVVTSSAGAETSLDMTELAALNDLSGTDLAKIDGITNGTVAAGKAAVVDSNKDIGDFRNLDAVNFDAGASGTAGSFDVFPTTAAKGKLTISATDNTGDTATIVTNAAMGQASTISIPDPGASTANFSLSATPVLAAEHGAGAIGTAVAPKTYRWTEKGVIITQIKFDLTGLASVATANDVIGLAAGGAAYIGRNVVATNGVIFKVELACLETPAGGDNDVNVVANSSAVLAYDGAGGTTYLSNSGDLLAGQTIENLLPALTANDYFYLTAGTGDTAATYTAGQYVLTLYGHALIS